MKTPVSDSSDDEGSSIKTKILETMEEFEIFRKTYNEYETVHVEYPYLITSTLVRVFYKEGEEDKYLAGYIINANGTIRYFDLFDANAKRIILRDKGLKEELMVEIGGLFIKPELSKIDKEARLVVYYHAIEDALATGKEYIIGGSRQFVVWKTFQTVLKKDLYFGYIPFDDALEIGKIVYDTREDLHKNLVEYKEKQPKSSPPASQRMQPVLES